jgi:hypothetical protein
MSSSPAAAYDATRNKRALQQKVNGMNMDGDDFDELNLNKSDTAHQKGYYPVDTRRED